MRKIVKTGICCIILFVLCLPLSGCGLRIKNPRRLFPLTEKEIKKEVQKKYFDEDGNAIKWYWELTDSNFSKFEYGGDDITGFSIEFIKGLNGKEEWFLVEFEPTGHIIGSIYESFRYCSSYFCAYPSPYKLLGVENKIKYVISQEPNYQTICGIEQDDYVYNISGITNWKYIIRKCPEPTGYMRIYNLSTQEWEENVYVGFFDDETKTWIKETQGEKK